MSSWQMSVSLLLRAKVVDVQLTLVGQMPFADADFDLILNRHFPVQPPRSSPHPDFRRHLPDPAGRRLLGGGFGCGLRREGAVA